ncbi:rhomboid family intramembrane serine protease [Desulfatiferula olefinivorans]
MKLVCRTRFRKKSNLLGLILSSQGIRYTLDRYVGGYRIWVSDEEHERARSAIHLYIEENRGTKPKATSFVERFHHTYSGLFAALLIFWVHTQLPPGQARESVIEQYGASASAILDGEVYRTATALFLHVDDIHLAGNMGGLLLFGTSVAGITGTGLGWFLILVTGMLGNGINAWFFQTRHLSIGASTAIFGALGILAGYRTVRSFEEKGFHPSIILPVGAGLALLALLGAGERSDLTAHLFGYLAGLGCGGLYARLVTKRPPERVQILFLGLTAVMVGLCWLPFR